MGGMNPIGGRIGGMTEGLNPAVWEEFGGGEPGKRPRYPNEVFGRGGGGVGRFGRGGGSM